jgi:DNA-binding NtrC family response regulator
MNSGPAHVLLIEDNPGDADLVRLRLVEGKSDVQVNCVPRLSDALACLEVETPSLVLLDLNLPDSHGAETFRKITHTSDLHSPVRHVAVGWISRATVARQLDYLKTVLKSVNQLHAMIRDLLEATRADSGKLRVDHVASPSAN